MEEKKQREWQERQETERKYEKHKQMIQNSKKRQAHDLEIKYKQNFQSPKRQKTGRIETRHIFKGPEGTIIDENELRRTKVKIDRIISRKYQNTSRNTIERNIENLDDIILPRRRGEGRNAIFDRKELKAKQNIGKDEELRTISIVDNKSERMLSIAKESFSLSRRNSDGNMISHFSRKTERRREKEGKTRENDERERERREKKKDKGFK